METEDVEGKGAQGVEQRIDVKHGIESLENDGQDGRKGDLDSHF